jgi:hypothetical protein
VPAFHHEDRVPVTARLSRAFYDKLGEDVANELVEWFNQVDATYRSDLRTLNELNFARFDAKLEQRAVRLETRLDHLEVRLEQGLAMLRGEFRAELGAAMTSATADFRRGQAELRSELLKWMFLFWVSTLGTLVLLRGP